MAKRNSILIVICSITAVLLIGSVLMAQQEKALKGTLFVVTLTLRSDVPPDGVPQIIARRAEWQYPEGIKPIAEYWLAGPGTEDPNVVSIIEAADSRPIYAMAMAWRDVFDISIRPAITVEEGLEMARMMAR